MAEVRTIEGYYLADEKAREDIASLINNDEIELYKRKIGVFQNKNREHYTKFGNLINFGEPNEPPLVDTARNNNIDIIAHFYNDFGLKSTALAANATNGSWSWYDWSWLHSMPENYDEKRVPLLGYYAGDNRRTLDWILYFLAKGNVNTISVVATKGININTWMNETDPHYWAYVMLNQCKNINAFKVLFWMGTHQSMDAAYINESFDSWYHLVSNYPNLAYTYNINGKRYVGMYLFDGNYVRGVLDNWSGSANTSAWLLEKAEAVKALGFDGIVVFGRNMLGNSFNYEALENGDVLLYGTEYAPNTQDATTYEEYANMPYKVNNLLDERRIPCAVTDFESCNYHPSTYNLTGSTPELFLKSLTRCVEFMERFKTPKILTVYNVSEWAEGGAGLIPNMRDGLNYLHALAAIQTMSKEYDPFPAKDDRYIFIGDSYTSGQDEDKTFKDSWAQKCANVIGSDKCIIKWMGGAGFSAKSTNNLNYQALLESAANELSATERKKVTRIICGGGFNDSFYDAAVINADFARFVTYASETFPNAKISFIRMGFSDLYSHRKRIKDQTQMWLDLCGQYGVDCFIDACLALHEYTKSIQSDHIHPTAYGSEQLFKVAIRYILTGNKDIRFSEQGNADNNIFVSISNGNCFIRFEVNASSILPVESWGKTAFITYPYNHNMLAGAPSTDCVRINGNVYMYSSEGLKREFAHFYLTETGIAIQNVSLEDKTNVSSLITSPVALTCDPYIV